MNPLIENIYRTSQVEDSEGNFINPFPTAISRDKGLALYNLVRKIAAQNTLEIGMAYGLSTLFLCQAHADQGGGFHTAMDHMQSTRWKSIGLLNIQRAGLGNFFRFYHFHSYRTLPKLMEEEKKFDLIFLDGSHLYDFLTVDFFYSDCLLKKKGLLVFDDFSLPAIRKVLRFVLHNRNYRLATEHMGAPLPLWKQYLVHPTLFLRNPLRAISYGPNLGRIFLDYCVLQKISDDRRAWDHFQPF